MNKLYMAMAFGLVMTAAPQLLLGQQVLPEMIGSTATKHVGSPAANPAGKLAKLTTTGPANLLVLDTSQNNQISKEDLQKGTDAILVRAATKREMQNPLPWALTVNGVSYVPAALYDSALHKSHRHLTVKQAQRDGYWLAKAALNSDGSVMPGVLWVGTFQQANIPQGTIYFGHLRRTAAKSGSPAISAKVVSSSLFY